MNLFKKTNSFFFLILLSLAVIIPCHAQIVPYYPIEIYFSPVGYTNHLPGCKKELHTTFSSLKIVLNKDLPSTENINNTLYFVGNLDLYHNTTNAGDYIPMLCNPAIRSHFFINDIFTLGLDLNGAVEYFPGNDLKGNVFRVTNYRLRTRPFTYLIITPNLIFHQMFNYGVSKFSQKTGIESDSYKQYDTLYTKDTVDIFYTDTDTIIIDQEVIKNIDSSTVTTYSMISRDYYIFKYEAKFIYLTPFHTRLFLVPFAFYNHYLDLPARSADGSPKSDNPKLKENGYGCALGFRYYTFTWGFTEAAFEYERNNDLIYDANSYTKLKVSTKWENQYFTERFGFLLIFDWIKHISKNFATGFPDESNISGTLGQMEIDAALMLIFNINRNISLRPEYYFLYKDLPASGNETEKGSEDIMKSRYSLHLHILL